MKVLLPKSRTLIKNCSVYARDSYNDLTKDVDYINDDYTDCRIYFSVKNNVLYIYGPGSVSIRDWSLDFQVWRKMVDYFDNSLVHAGFMRIYEAVRSRIHEKVNHYLLNNKLTKIVCTGHSLFGAVATIIATDVAMNIDHDLPVSCVTFGSPRVGNNRFAELFNNTIFESFRCVYRKDPVTFSPLPIRFKHVRGLIRHNGAGLDIIFNKYNLCGCRINHHSMDTYCEEFSKEST